MSSPTRDLSFGADGLVPVVIQDADTGEVLTLAHANWEAIARTLETGETHLWSRSRGELWHKGATSGHRQAVVAVKADCDADAVLYQVRPQGPACHTGAETCFHQPLHGAVPPSLGALLSRLAAVVASRRRERPEGSYTAYLLDKGLDKICKKVGEEATEVVIALKNGAPEPIAAEAADLLYHLIVGLEAAGVGLPDVAAALEGRLGQSGRVPGESKRV
ncbi:MAG: bifunctional phosphoribosyl-AMP cyclohydrolase/phosphoribosyl-ATP diphosphatase HisIE [Candidatus Sericytochromatia bacterium]|nr:bifunctional phosphoribosyl-AMP cyclohydrolase/phosphoribosyl-ATP diphosphatase HisIE [Candidatus Tanganyikabacteria bacterium]